MKDKYKYGIARWVGRILTLLLWTMILAAMVGVIQLIQLSGN